MSGRNPTLRLDRLLANLGYGSRREVEGLVKRRLVVLDGRPLTRADAKVGLDPDLPERMHVGAEPLDPLPGLLIMLHKPVGVTCSHKESGELVYALLPERWRRRKPAISTVGRLDKDTSGLLLLTDDGDLLHHIISPRFHLEKSYRVTVDRPLTGTEADIFASGELMLEGEQKPLLPARLRQHTPNEATVVITEGRYHQVRRMFASIGSRVTQLHRERIGGLTLPDDLAPGEWRVLGEPEREAIFYAR